MLIPSYVLICQKLKSHIHKHTNALHCRAVQFKIATCLLGRLKKKTFLFCSISKKIRNSYIPAILNDSNSEEIFDYHPISLAANFLLHVLLVSKIIYGLILDLRGRIFFSGQMRKCKHNLLLV